MIDEAIFQRLGSDREVLSVSQLNARARQLLEDVFPRIWVEGEISNLSRPSSGHVYLTLKDSRAQVRCALFRQNAARIRLDLRDGLLVQARGRVSLYEGRGDYQLILDTMEPAGDGALRQAFEALKAKLQAEGLFDAATKRALPGQPRRIGVITSPTGAALRDIISVFRRRAPSIELIVVPTAVQGRDAAPQIVKALQLADRAGFDALILARGGGSLEDLWPFNEEPVARALHACSTPTVCAVGHETDVSISDFCADVRAPTPSAAAELLSPDQAAMLESLANAERRLLRCMQIRLMHGRNSTDSLRKRLRHPGERLAQQSQRLDELDLRLQRAQRQLAVQHQHRLQTLATRLQTRHPRQAIAVLRQRLQELSLRLPQASSQQLRQRRTQFQASAHALQLVSPLATLGRGYSILLDKQGKALRSSRDVQQGQRLEARLADGSVAVRVEADPTEPHTLSLLD